MGFVPKKFHLNHPELAQAVAEALPQCQEAKAFQRLLAMRLAAQGEFTAQQIADHVGISRRQFFNWVDRLKTDGVEGLLHHRPRSGRPARLSASVREQLVEGLRAGRWKRAWEIQQWLRTEHAVSLELSSVYYWLGKLGGVRKVPRRTHAQKDAAQGKEFQETLADRLVTLNVAGDRKVRLWVADEHRYGLIPVVRHCWGLRGERVVVPYQTRYEWGYLYSALEVDGEQAAQFLFLPSVSLELSRLFLEHLAASDPEAEHVVIWDNAGFHPRPEDPDLPERIHLLPLPPYRPELNPVEAIGDVVKDRIANRLWEDLDAMEEAMSEELRPLLEDPRRVKRLVAHPWLALQANAIAN